MNSITIAYKRNGIIVLIPCCHYGVLSKNKAPYQFPEDHPCRGCPYTLQTSVPSCIFPERPDGSCFWYDLKNRKKPAPQKTARQEAADRIFQFIQVLERVSGESRKHTGGMIYAQQD
jgi:hypothetical protein